MNSSKPEKDEKITRPQERKEEEQPPPYGNTKNTPKLQESEEEESNEEEERKSKTTPTFQFKANHNESSSSEEDEESSSSEEDSVLEKKIIWTSVKSVGVSMDMNPRFRKTMEDEHVLIDSFGDNPQSGYFAIYDGHGGRGAVEYVAKSLHQNLLLELKQTQEIPEAIKQSYLKTDDQIKQSPIQFSGTTSVSAFITIHPETKSRVLYIANAGDARAVLNRNGKAVRLSYDHKGSDESETKRIVDMGGFVVLNRVNGILAVTRSLGDCALKNYVIGDPFQTTTDLNQNDTHLILACDGLWDVISDQEAIDLIKSEESAQKMADILLQFALKNGSTDNISIMVILL